MQQTETYKLNKPEMSDPFSPAPLSENMDTVDATLADHEQRMVALEGCRLIIGTYKGTGTSNSGGQTIDLGERPVAVLVSNQYVGSAAATSLIAGGYTITSSRYSLLRLTDNGFWVDVSFNQTGDFSFLALLGGWPAMTVPQPET